MIDKAPAERFVSLNEDSLKCVQDSEASEVYGIAVQKGNTKLLNDINEGLKKSRKMVPLIRSLKNISMEIPMVAA